MKKLNEVKKTELPLGDLTSSLASKAYTPIT